MTKEKANFLLMQYKDKIPSERVLALRSTLEKAPEESYDYLNAISFKSSTTTLILAIFLGGLGVDRFYVGDIGLGVCKLLFGAMTLGIWPLIDIFFSYKKAKEINYNRIMAAVM